MTSTIIVAVGCYTPPAGTGSGIARFAFDTATGAIRPLDRHPATSPSWLARHPTLPVLYAAQETDPSRLLGYRLDVAGLTPIGSADLDGAEACHLEFTADAGRVLATNYTSGTLSVIELDPEGRPAGIVPGLRFDGSGPDPERQESAHPHQSVRLADGSFLVTDLGQDLVHRILASGQVRVADTVALPPGTGPRHVAVTADEQLAYVSGELDSTLLTLQRSRSGGWAVRGAVSATAAPAAERNYPAHLALTADERRLIVANRGADVLTVFDVTGEHPVVVAETACGRWPRHFAMVGDEWLLVAAQLADRISVLRLDPASGRLSEHGGVAAGSPTCIVVV